MPKLLTETKHFQAASQIRELVNTLSPGEVLPVASELMETLNISHGTAMRALKVLADEGVIVRPMGKLRYRIAERFEPGFGPDQHGPAGFSVERPRRNGPERL